MLVDQLNRARVVYPSQLRKPAEKFGLDLDQVRFTEKVLPVKMVSCEEGIIDLKIFEFPNKGMRDDFA
jgi:hypothetical protein